ncbi:MAG: biosynthetic-type acetolactate synthase large subunit [Bacteroidales bacterium]
METKTDLKEEKKTKATQNIKGSEAVILSLLNEGVDTIFGYPGGAIMPIYDALYDYQDRIKHILVRHEQGATHMATGYSKASGKVGVVFATSGPGATNLITGIANAKIDSIPLVCVTGQVSSHLLGFDAFQETDVVGISMPVTKWNYQITKAREIPEVFAKAFYIANSGRPGPVLIDITKDAQNQLTEYEYKKFKQVSGYFPNPKLNIEKVREAANLINNSKKPFLLVGHGINISGAEEELLTFVNKTGIPVGSTLLGLSSFPTKHPLYVGMLGMHGNYAPNILTNEADLIIAVGMRFDDRVTGDTTKYAKKAKVIHIDIDQAEIDKNIKAEVAIVSDAKKALVELISLVKTNTHNEWIEEFKKLETIEFDKIIHKDIHPKTGEIKMAEVVHQISERTKGEAIVVTDVGQHQMMAARYYQFARNRSIITSGGLGTMGFGVPAAFGAAMGQDSRPVIVFVGDGGIQMTIQEMATIWQHNKPVKIVLLNNGFLGMVRQWQQLFHERRYSFTTLVNPDFQTIAKGNGIESTKIENREDLVAAIDKMLETDGPYMLEVIVEQEDNVFPMVPAGAGVSDIILEP